MCEIRIHSSESCFTEEFYNRLHSKGYAVRHYDLETDEFICVPFEVLGYGTLTVMQARALAYTTPEELTQDDMKALETLRRDWGDEYYASLEKKND